MAKDKSCDACQYSGIMRNTDASLLKVCRRNPPTVHMIMQAIPGGGVQQGTCTVWPSVDGGDWCGEFLPGLNG